MGVRGAASLACLPLVSVCLLSDPVPDRGPSPKSVCTRCACCRVSACARLPHLLRLGGLRGARACLCHVSARTKTCGFAEPYPPLGFIFYTTPAEGPASYGVASRASVRGYPRRSLGWCKRRVGSLVPGVSMGWGGTWRGKAASGRGVHVRYRMVYYHTLTQPRTNLEGGGREPDAPFDTCLATLPLFLGVAPIGWV